MSVASSLHKEPVQKEIRLHGDVISDAQLIKLFNPAKVGMSHKEASEHFMQRIRHHTTIDTP